MRIADTAVRLASGGQSSLESSGNERLSPPEVLEGRIAARLAASAPEVPADVVAALAASKAKDGHATAQQLTRGEKAAVDLTDDALANLEAVIRVSNRPAWFVLDDFPRIDGEALNDTNREFWITLITPARKKMRSVCSAVGCIFKEQDSTRTPIGTGWLIAEQTLITNAHVAGHLALLKPGVLAGDPRGGWRLRPDVKGVVDFIFEHGKPQGTHVEITQVLYIETAPAPDIAVFRVQAGGAAVWPPIIELDLDRERPAGWRDTFVFAVGHPAADLQADVNVQTVFGPLDATKRVSPGQVMDILGCDVLAHDCSTTHGSSGSPLVDLASYKAVGLHYFGQPGERNEASFLAALAQHPAIVKSRSGQWGI